LITVDNGTVSELEIATLKAAGIDTIVCDHHQPQEGHLATSALAILNPKQDDCQYPFKELCGCGLAWKLMVELYKELSKDWQPLKWELDLVAFSTIADMVPLLGENRVLASFGLQVARKSRNIGLRALAGVAGIDLEKISAGSIGFQLAPRINAPSRMHGELEKGLHVALSLLTTTDKDEADRLATYLNGMNGERQSLLTRHLQDAELQAVELKDDLCLVLYDENWSSGVIGLVAGRMLEKYSRPTVVLALEGEVIKGSVRSLGSLHAVELMASAEDLLERYGGHGKAGGLTVKKGVDAIQLRSTLNQWAASQGWELAAMLLAARKEADLELPLSEANLGLVEELSALEPFGIGFPGPLFEATCTLEAVRRVGKEQQHLSCFLVDGSTRRKAIAFSQGDTDVVDGQLYKVFYTLEAEEWNGVRSASCQIRRIEAA
jgi:single-stranded-DNA-specific exonuclease